MHKVDCVSNISQGKELTARKAYQTIKQGPFESLVHYSKQFCETHQCYKNTLSATNPVNIEEKEQAMDFFHGLHQGKYGLFKTSMLNGWAAGAFDPRDTVNKIFKIVQLPGTKESFAVNEEASKLTNKERVYYHSTVAKLLYLSKQARARYTDSGNISMYWNAECECR
jgi:hypothetical protein